MDFSHYPRLENDLVLSWHWPRPPDCPPFKSLPAFGPRNRALEALAPGAAIVGYHSAANFTRFLGSLACDQPLSLLVQFSNDEVAPDGNYVQDSNVATLNWDLLAAEKSYKPGESHSGFWAIRLGKWLRVEVTNLGDKPTSFLRVYVRGSTL